MLNLSRFIDIEFYCFDGLMAKKIGEENTEPYLNRRKICVDEIAAYEGAILATDKVLDKRSVCVILKSGIQLVCAISFADFENLLSDFDFIDKKETDSLMDFT